MRIKNIFSKCKTSYATLNRIMKDKIDSYKSTTKAQEWFEDHWDLLKLMFSNVRIRDFIFEPFKGVFTFPKDDPDKAIKGVITSVALANAVIASLPGKLGVGVFVSMALEAYMAYLIATSVGFKLESPKDIWKYMGLLAGTLMTITVFFSQILNMAFSLFNTVGALPATFLAELVTTNFVGVCFWIGFEEAKNNGSFTIPKRMWGLLKKRVTDLLQHQRKRLVNILSPSNLKLVGTRLKMWISGEITVAEPFVRGEAFSFVAMASIINGNIDELDGPLGSVFIKSIRRAYSTKLGEATLEEISDFFSDRTPSQLAGDVNLVKGEMFEHLIEDIENLDSDAWTAQLHELRNVPGSDIIFSNIETGEQIEISLKSVGDPNLIEKALLRYPNTPILTTEEMEEYFGDNPMVDFSDISNDHLEQITRDNFDDLVEHLEPINAVDVAASGVLTKALVQAWPFVVAYMRSRITKDQLSIALVRVFGESGIALTSRLSFALILGPVFAWYLLARSVMVMSKE